MAVYDSKSSTSTQRVNRIYKDLNLDFLRNPTTSDVTKLEDVEAVKRSVKNLIQTNHYERPFHPEIGSDVRALLFENMTPFTASTLSRKIEDTINNFEPRALLAGVEVYPNFDNNTYEVIVEFYLQNAPSELVDISFALERLR